MTNSARLRESSVMMSSATPSEKYSCAGSPPRLSNGSTAIEGLSGSGKASGAGTGSVDGTGTAASAVVGAPRPWWRHKLSPTMTDKPTITATSR